MSVKHLEILLRDHPPGEDLSDPVTFDDGLGVDSYSGRVADILVTLCRRAGEPGITLEARMAWLVRIVQLVERELDDPEQMEAR